MIHFNMDPVTIRHGGRKAPIITKNELELLLKAAVPYDPEDGGGFGDPSSIDSLLYEALADYDPSPLAKARKDLEKVWFNFENVQYQSTEVSANGIPFFWVMAGGDWEIPVYFMLYFDGKEFRGYVPVYGNSFNPKTKTAFGSDEDSENDRTGTYSYVEDGVSKTVTVRSEESFEKFRSRIYGYVEPCKEACFEAFNARVEAVGSMTHEQVKAAVKKLETRAKKLFEEL